MSLSLHLLAASFTLFMGVWPVLGIWEIAISVVTSSIRAFFEEQSEAFSVTSLSLVRSRMN